MANVKSRLKEPKSAPTQPKRGRGRPRKLVRGPEKVEIKVKESKATTHKTKNRKPTNKKTNTSKKNYTGTKQTEETQLAELTTKDCHIVMKRPSTNKVLMPDEKIQYVLENGEKLKDKFIVKPANVKMKPDKVEPPVHCKRKQDPELPLKTKSGRLNKKTKLNMKLIDSILRNELMINDNKNTDSNNAEALQAAHSPASLALLPGGVNNNNDIDLSDQNEDFSSDDGSDYVYSEDVCNNTSDDYSDENFSDIPVEKDLKPKKKVENMDRKNDKKESSLKQPKPKQQPTTLKYGVEVPLASFECDLCEKTFSRKFTLRKHMFIHLNIKPFTCKWCPQQFRSRYNMQVHVNRYHPKPVNDPKLFVCNFCQEPFLLKRNLELHLATHTNSENSFKCIYCRKVFPYHIKLMQHERKRHRIQGYYHCTLCPMTYRERYRLYEHIKGHLKIKDFICQYCGKEFMRHSSIKRHLEICHDDHRIVCPICKKSLKGHLTEHMRTHEKKRPHKCNDCGQRFTQSTQLNVHRRSHTGARPYSCRICNQTFSHSNALMLHIRRHTGEKPFSCAMCPMSFSQLPHMKAHMRKIHGKENPYKCQICNSFFKLKSQLDVHAMSCQAETGKKSVKGKTQTNKKGEEDIVVESSMPLPRMRFLLALLLTMIATTEKLKFLGFNKRLIDDLLVESLEAMDQTPCKDESISPLTRLRTNIEMLLVVTVPKDQLESFKLENRSTEDILELLTTEKK